MTTETFTDKTAVFEADYTRHIQDEAAPQWLIKMRRDALAQFVKAGFPARRNEEWKYTDTAALAAVGFRLSPAASLDAGTIAQLPLADLGVIQVVFVNGRYRPDLSTLEEMPAGVRVAGIAQLLISEPDMLSDLLGESADASALPFAALNSAFLQDGAYVAVARGAVIEQPIQLLYVSVAEHQNSVSHPRTILLAGEQSQCMLIETYAAVDSDYKTFTNAVTQIEVGKSAHVDHYKTVDCPLTAYHIATTQVSLAQESRFSSTNVTLRGAFVRNDINATLSGEHCECVLNGLFMADGDRLVDNHTFIDHAVPNCVSHELYKGILDGHSRGVFNGKVMVRQDAQKTDAKQTNKTLLLSRDALIDTKPQLEIFADDVKCTHGATVGQLDDEQIFYLRSRGIKEQDARNLLVYAFAADVTSRVLVGTLRDALAEALPSPQQKKEA